MSCRKTPQPARAPGGPKSRKARHPGGLFFWLLFFGQAKKSDPAFPKRGLALRRRQEDGSPRQAGQVAVSLKPKTEALDD